MENLTGRVALVTGGASGMGAAHSRILAEHGATVAVCDINADLGKPLAAEIGGAFHQLDVCDERQWSATLDAITAQHGPVTILVNNAGKGLVAPVQDTSTDDWNRIMAINVTGPFFGIRAVAPQMKAAGGGVIVNVSSTAALRGHAAAGSLFDQQVGGAGADQSRGHGLGGGQHPRAVAAPGTDPDADESAPRPRHTLRELSDTSRG